MIGEGIDVSHHNGVIDWAAVSAAGIGFAYAKATEGDNFTDPRFAGNHAGAHAHGLKRGAYHFFRPLIGPDAQARHFLKVCPTADSLPAALDVETHDGASSLAIVTGMRVWLAAVEQAHGKRPIIYTSASFWNVHVGSDAFKDYDLWVAHYTTRPGPSMPGAWKDWALWQYTDHATVGAGVFDMSRARPGWIA